MSYKLVIEKIENIVKKSTAINKTYYVSSKKDYYQNKIIAKSLLSAKQKVAKMDYADNETIAIKDYQNDIIAIKYPYVKKWTKID